MYNRQMCSELEFGLKKLFIILKAEFGPTDHLYNCDTFNEMVPSTNDTGWNFVPLVQFTSA